MEDRPFLPAILAGEVATGIEAYQCTTGAKRISKRIRPSLTELSALTVKKSPTLAFEDQSTAHLLVQVIVEPADTTVGVLVEIDPGIAQKIAVTHVRTDLREDEKACFASST